MKSFPQSFTSTAGEQSYTMKKQRASRTSKGNLRFYDAIVEFGGLTNAKFKATGYVHDLRAFCLYLKNPDLKDVTWQDIQNYTNEILEIGWTEQLLVQKYRAFRKFFEHWHLKDKGSCLDPRWIPVMHSQRVEPNVITEENYKKLINIIPKESVDSKSVRNLALINLLWDTQAEYADILALDVQDIDLKKRSAKSITCRWSKETNENLRAWLVLRTALKTRSTVTDRNALFIGCAGKKVWKRLERSGLSQLLWRYCEKAKIKFFNPNSFRREKGFALNNDDIKKDVANILEYAKWRGSINYRVI